MYRVFLCCLVIILAVHVYAATFARLEVDDYGQATVAYQQGVINAVISRYNRWNARYSQVAVSSILYLLFGSHADAAGAVTTVIALAASAFYLFRPWTHRAFLFALVLTWGILTLQPNWFQNFLWLPGNVTYLMPLALLMSLLGWLLRLGQESSSADSAKP